MWNPLNGFGFLKKYFGNHWAKIISEHSFGKLSSRRVNFRGSFCKIKKHSSNKNFKRKKQCLKNCFHIKYGWYTKIKLVQGSSFLCLSSSECKFVPLGMHVNVHHNVRRGPCCRGSQSGFFRRHSDKLTMWRCLKVPIFRLMRTRHPSFHLISTDNHLRPHLFSAKFVRH